MSKFSRNKNRTTDVHVLQSEGRHAVNATSGLREAVIGFSDDGDVLFYYPEDVGLGDDDDFEVEGRWAGKPALPGEPMPLLALKPGGSGLWLGKPSEWEEAVPNGWVAFTEDDEALLRQRAEVGDLLIPLYKPS